eukprot:COSAG05_NODE_7286_length_833_cov_0.967302_1_plen_132_part_00
MALGSDTHDVLDSRGRVYTVRVTRYATIPSSSHVVFPRQVPPERCMPPQTPLLAPPDLHCERVTRALTRITQQSPHRPIDERPGHVEITLRPQRTRMGVWYAAEYIQAVWHRFSKRRHNELQRSADQERDT